MYFFFFLSMNRHFCNLVYLSLSLSIELFRAKSTLFDLSSKSIAKKTNEHLERRKNAPELGGKNRAIITDCEKKKKKKKKDKKVKKKTSLRNRGDEVERAREKH